MGRFGLGQENWTHIQFCDVLLTEQLLPVMRDISGEFNQSINQVELARQLASWNVKHPLLFAKHVVSNSPHLNPVDCRIWEEL